MFNNVNDGPMLQDLTIESWWFDYIKNWEIGVFEQINNVVPDMIIYLKVNAETALDRKKGSLDVVQNKINVLDQIYTETKKNVFILDSNIDLPQIKNSVRSKIWSLL